VERFAGRIAQDKVVRQRIDTYPERVRVDDWDIDRLDSFADGKVENDGDGLVIRAGVRGAVFSADNDGPAIGGRTARHFNMQHAALHGLRDAIGRIGELETG